MTNLDERDMKTFSFPIITPLILCVACASTPPPVGRIEARGDRYIERESPELARAEYALALKDEPKNTRLREKLSDAETALLKARADQVAEALEQGTPLVAAYTLSKARREFGPEHPGVLAIEESVTAGLQVALRTAEKNAQFGEAATLHSALLAYVPERSRANRQDQKNYEQAWAKQLRERALQDEEQRLHASSSLHWLKTFGLTRDARDQDRARTQRARALATHTYSVSLFHDAQAMHDQRLVLPHLERAIAQPGVTLLTDGSAATGATFTITLRDLRCDLRQEMRAPNKVASPRAMLIQRCMTSFSSTLMPTDTYRPELADERLLVEEIVHQTDTLETQEQARYELQLVESLHAQGATIVHGLIARDFRVARDRILERARTLPLERAVLDAEITLFWLEPTTYGTQDILDDIEKQSGLQDAGKLIRME